MNYLAMIFAFLLASTFSTAKEPDFDCQKNKCGLISDKAYPHLVVGTIGAVAEPDESKKVFNWARQHQQWQYLPADADKFYDSVGLVSIIVDGSGVKKPVTVMIPRQEVGASLFKPGDFVRYTPHRGDYEKPPENTPEAIAYWSATGCVAILCRAENGECKEKYKQGLFRLPDGKQMTLAGKDYPNGIAVNTISMLPIVGQ